MAKQSKLQSRALAKARGGQSTCNYRAILEGFMAMGVGAEEILPRVNVLTFHAWKALGRCVSKGHHGVKVTTFIPVTKTEAHTGKTTGGSMPRVTTVFHISQTEKLGVLKN
jgi:N-terminal domain of anti-restriction factor ArdC